VIRNRPAADARAPHVVVVGGGVGGLAAALRLAAAGLRVTLYERAAVAGGKLRSVEVGGRPIDAGPTVVTMPHVFAELFESAGARLEDLLTLSPVEPACRHFFADGSRLDTWNDRPRSREAISALCGEAEARGFDAFCDHAARIFSYVRGTFLEQPAPTSMLGMLRPSLLLSLPGLLHIDARRSLWAALGSFFRDPRLRMLFGRYATYNGSSPMHAPATLSVIAHVEQAFGIHAIAGGIGRLAEALCAVARERGAIIHTGAEVERVLVEGKRVVGVAVGGERVAADAVVVNCDALHLYRRLLGAEPGAAAAADRLSRHEPSLSAFLLLATAAPTDFPLSHHNVFFSSDYPREFDELIGRGAPPEDPTVYLCASDRAPGAAAVGPTAERHLLLTNAPATADERQPETVDWDAEAPRCRTRMLETLHRCGLDYRPAAERIVTPAEMARLFPSSRGAIYGASSNSRTAAFERPPNRVPGWRGLYCVGGSAHPGAGLPMVVMSARIACGLLLSDLGQRAVVAAAGPR